MRIADIAQDRMKLVLILGLCACASWAAAADEPPADAFRIFPPAAKEAPVITPYLQYQTEMAWQQDDERRKEWGEIKTEQDLLAVQRHAEEHLLTMLGGLPSERTPLHPRITGKIQMDGFRIEKLIFESLPGIYVSALVYVPQDGNEKHPGILVPAGHAENGKVHYQALCQRLVQRGYVVIAWDPVGQGERSQFWDKKAGKSRYNLICAEHAVLGNLAYLAGTNLARWEIWDGIRAVDYLLTRPEVDPERINITGTSGGGFQAAHIPALDHRIKVAAPSCYITALPMRVYNRIFQDPDSDPEQDLYGMISNHVDNPGLLLMMYPRPVFVAAAVLDFFPIEGAHKTVREVIELYSKFQHADRIGMAEGYHGHEFSPENQEAAMNFLDHFNGLPLRRGLPPVKELDDKTLQCTRTGQVMLEFEDARSLMDVIREYYVQHKNLPAETLRQLYYSNHYPRINSWIVAEFQGEIPGRKEIRWEARGSSQFEGVTIDKYVLHHSRYLELPLLYFHKADGVRRPVVLWLGKNGKATAQDWTSLRKYLDAGYDIVSVDPRGLGEMRMAYKAASPDDPALAQLDFDRAYVSPISGVLADYVYNSILTGRPYFLQMIEDVEIATRFFRAQVNIRAEFSVAGSNGTFTLASAVSETLPNIKLLSEPDGNVIPWSELVNQKTELWPIEYLLPSGAYIH
ncbi:MAG TPA: acetylxylan esterase [Candidatus Sulfotelmatobacter sp.]|nr:acetylxylan esterase [Candidatus Sulfotelmatobacter sp.]